MKARDLIKSLEELHPDTKIIVAKDSEGNGFSPAAGVTQQYYVEETSWSGELVDDDDVAEDDSDVENVAVIWPIN